MKLTSSRNDRRLIRRPPRRAKRRSIRRLHRGLQRRLRRGRNGRCHRRHGRGRQGRSSVTIDITTRHQGTYGPCSFTRIHAVTGDTLGSARRSVRSTRTSQAFFSGGVGIKAAVARALNNHLNGSELFRLSAKEAHVCTVQAVVARAHVYAFAAAVVVDDSSGIEATEGTRTVVAVGAYDIPKN